MRTFEEIVECTWYPDQNSSMGTIVEQGVSVVIRKASDAIPLKTSPEQPLAPFRVDAHGPTPFLR
jgi:hypothetical protein